MGRKTYDKMLQLAPKQAFFPEMENYVFSTTKTAGENVTFAYIT